ncbi:MAG: ATP-binding cassette domain-containing protein [Candidatus Cloacimonetes bacterium]|nr:ATP-binding cassette domain-containing protein [Candidatus Cloacimonadota bacterium]
MLRLKNITKRYENIIAVNNLSLEIPPNSIFGLLGPNGAGKTTTIRIINQIAGLDSGDIFFDDEKMKPAHTEIIGYMPEERGLYLNMKVGEQLVYLAELKGMKSKTAREKINFWLEKFKITDWYNKKVSELSKGMQQKIQFITTVLHDPGLLIFDEPFTGLDPINTEIIKNEIRTLRENGATIIFSTHRMEQVEEICEEIALINKGEIILRGNIKELKEKFKKNHFLIEFEGVLPEHIEEYKIIEKFDHSIILEITNDEDSNLLLNHLLKSVKIKTFKEILPTLNEIFIDAVKGETDE